MPPLHKGGNRSLVRDWTGLDTETPGEPGHRTYSNRHVRNLVAYQTVVAFAGKVRTAQHKRAIRLLAAAPAGYVVMAQGRAWWSYSPPLSAAKAGAVILPVPAWRH